MKTTSLFITGLLILSIMGISLADTSDYGALGALDKTDYTLEEMLTYAIQDEYTALAEYELILSEYGNIRPFTNIAKAETTHISLLEPLFETYGFELPKNESNDIVMLPDTLYEAYKTGVQAEIDNIAMYDAFLSKDLPTDVEKAFESLKNASENHLKAFERQVSK